MNYTITRRSRNLGYAWTNHRSADPWRGPDITGAYKTIAAEHHKQFQRARSAGLDTFSCQFYVDGHPITADQWDEIVSLHESYAPADSVEITVGE